MERALVQDMAGRSLSPCDAEKALRLVSEGRAELVCERPLTIRLAYAVQVRARGEKQTGRERSAPDYQGRRLLLHICCAPCATYTVKRLRELRWSVEGHWFNPNVHPYSEHELRRETLASYAETIGLPVHWESGYEIAEFLRAVVGHERFRERCLICYRMRLERTALAARRLGLDAISTTLLISPYQDQAAIRRIGEEMAALYGVAFYFENLRRGFAEHYRLSRESGLYMQRYCGCVYSEWESCDQQAWTNPRPVGERSAQKG